MLEKIELRTKLKKIPLVNADYSQIVIDKLQNVINMQTIKRYGTLDDILNVVNFYLSESSDMITGQKIYLGGL